MNSSQPTLRRATLALLAGAALTSLGLLLWSPSGATEGGSAATATVVPPRAVALAAAPAAPARREVPRGVGFYAAPVGTVLTYDLRGHFQYGLAHPEGGRQVSGVVVEGQLEVLVADRRDDAVLARASFPGLALSALAGGAGSDQNGLGKAAQQPFDVQLGADGKVRGYRFADSLDAEQRNFLRGLFAAYVHTVPATATGTWEAEDADGAGALVARFSATTIDADTVRVERRKLRYTELAGPELHPHTLTGGSTATFSRELGWLSAVDVDEKSSVQMVDLGLEISLHSVLAIALRAQRQDVPLAGDLWDGAWSPAAGCHEDLSACVDRREAARWSHLLEGKDLAGLIDELAALLAAQPRDAEAVDKAWQMLIWKVKLDPKAAAGVQAAVAAGLETTLADMLISALGAAGSEPAQAVLATMRRDGSLPAAVRTSATMSMFQLAHPNERVLGDVLADIGAADALAGDDALAMLLLGALAPRAGDLPVQGTTAMAALAAFEAKAERQGRLDLWLDALGNAGGPEVVPHAQRLCAHGDDVVRAAAYNALRKVDAPAALALLERGLRDASAAVRADVVGALGEHRSAAACAALIRTARDDADAAVRRACLQGLSGFANQDSPALRAIEQIAVADPDSDNRDAARAILQGRR